MKYEIINPSDEAYIEADEHEVASVANFLLSEGAYGLQQVDGDFEMPILLFGAFDWFEHNFDKSAQEIFDARKPDVKAALESVCLAGERTSLNDIVKCAKGIARQL